MKIARSQPTRAARSASSGSGFSVRAAIKSGRASSFADRGDEQHDKDELPHGKRTGFCMQSQCSGEGERPGLQIDKSFRKYEFHRAAFEIDAGDELFSGRDQYGAFSCLDFE